MTMTALTKWLIGIVIIGIIITGCVTSGKKVPQNTKEFAKTSAMLTLENKRSGGSGVIYKSTPTRSWVLTNKHVCNLLQEGGIVTTDQGSYPIHSFIPYPRHDLCLVQVMANLHMDTKLAEGPPALYSETIIAGHPALLPTMVTRGHFTKHMTIQLTIDTIPCDGDEEGDDVVLCLMFGKKPLVQSFDSQPTTALIMPGSSGSGVFNDRGEVVGLVFAGMEGLSYGMLVPYEFISDFLYNVAKYDVIYPKKNNKHKSLFADLQKIENFCRTYKDKCHHVSDSEIYHE